MSDGLFLNVQCSMLNVEMCKLNCNGNKDNANFHKDRLKSSKEKSLYCYLLPGLKAREYKM